MKRFKKIIKTIWKRLYLILGFLLAIQGIISLFIKELGDSNILFILSIIAFQQDDIIELKHELHKNFDSFLEHQKFNLSVFKSIIKYVNSLKENKDK